ncbi:MAG: YkgJ family cysteine cluster protein [Phycisphaerae bacterium]|nr:YkgJ family cysteine cluster protein [Phycisphaerae bacterium]
MASTRPKDSDKDSELWYQSGLQFECTQCGNCCTGAPGYVFVSEDEIDRIASFLGRPGQGLERHQYRRVGRGISLTEDKTTGDCVFLKRTSEGRRTCSIYPVRPLQCRTWPFWNSLLESREEWDEAARDCPGMNKGKSYDFVQIEIRRLAKDWGDLPS